jgi:SulP family sulfate permease
LVTVLREGYRLDDFRHDLIAGITVAIVALPLAMAFAIASGTTPDRGLVTAVVAGFLISALGGSRHQIGGPTGAFVVVVFGVIAKHGYDGLVLATLMAGVILIVAGFARLGTWIKYIPEPVITGFTAGIAVVIFSSQVKDLLGLQMGSVPAEFVPKWLAYFEHIDTLQWLTVSIAAASLAIVLLLRRYAPAIPGFLVALVVAAVAAYAFAWPTETVGSRFGAIPRTLPSPAWPAMSWSLLRDLLPSALTIAFLAGVESLLSAVVADGMTGRRHRSNCELVAQGVANSASALFGGMPATGAIARTVTNIRTGARTPVAGVLHAIFVLLFMLLAAPLAAYIPLAALAAVLTIVAWNMSEIPRFRHLMKAPLGDRVILLLTFGLTVMVDLTVAIEVGVVLAAVLFMHRMSQAVAVEKHTPLIDEDQDDFVRGPTEDKRRGMPSGVELFELRGPFFFGVAQSLTETLDELGRTPRGFVLLMREVPLIDATGVGALTTLVARAGKSGTRVVLVGAQPSVLQILREMHVLDRPLVATAATLDEAKALFASDPPS